MKILATRLKELREEKGITQQELAKIIGCSDGAISFWEKNINEPKATYIVALADYFNICTDYLLGRKDYY